MIMSTQINISLEKTGGGNEKTGSPATGMPRQNTKSPIQVKKRGVIYEIY